MNLLIHCHVLGTVINAGNEAMNKLACLTELRV